MHVYIVGNSIELALHLANKFVQKRKKIAIVANEKSLMPFEFSLLERRRVAFQGIDIYLQAKLNIWDKYDLIFFYNIPPAKDNTPQSGDIAIWILDNSVICSDPFQKYDCKKIMVIQNYTKHPMYDASIDAIDGYEKIYMPYSENDIKERLNLQLSGIWKYENLSIVYRNFLKRCENLLH